MSSITARNFGGEATSAEQAAAAGRGEAAAFASQRRGGGFKRFCWALAGAVAMNAVILGALAKLNAPPVFEVADRPELRVAVHEEREAERPEREPVEQEQVAELEAEVMEVAMDRPTPEMEMPAVAAMPFEAPSFEVAPPRVTVRSAPVSPAAPVRTREPMRVTGPVEAGDADQPGRAVRHPQPAYPRVALRRGATGHVAARVLVDERGRVEQVEIDEVVGHSAFEGAVRETLLSRWEYSTTRHGGRAVKAWHEVVIRFELEG